MVPSTYVSIDALPLTPNGKVDRRAVRLFSTPKAPVADSYVAPTTPHERMLSEICAKVLHLDRVGVTDSLFALGADSIHLFQIVARANEAGLALSPKQVLEGRTVFAMCKELDRSEIPKSVAGVQALVPVSRKLYQARR
jgi:hypothetical protein